MELINARKEEKRIKGFDQARKWLAIMGHVGLFPH